MPVVLCADDFALSPGVSAGILKLIAAGRLSATSAMVTTEAWVAGAGALASVAGQAAVGLHLNLTSGAPLSAMPSLAPRGQLPSIRTMIGLAVTGQLHVAELEHEISQQLDAFEAHFGMEPDFVDGHEHVHVLPVVRRCLLTAMRRRFRIASPLVRVPSDRLSAIARRPAAVKATVVRVLSAGFRNAVLAAGFRVNDSFAGFSDFDATRPFDRELDAFLRGASERHLVMCHPGVSESREFLTPHASRRVEEFDTLMRRNDLPNLIWHPRNAGSDARSLFAG